MGCVSTRGNELDLDNPPTIIVEAVTLLSWLRLHPRAQGITERNTLLDANECERFP